MANEQRSHGENSFYMYVMLPTVSFDMSNVQKKSVLRFFTALH